MHDMIYHTTEIGSYDHFMYPGVVERTFIGTIGMKIVTYPFDRMIVYFKLSKLYSLYINRAMLGICVIVSLLHFKNSFIKKFSEYKYIGTTFSIIFCLQFHYLYYSTRTLPNIYACILITLSLSHWLLNNKIWCIFYLSFTCIIFRCDMILIAIPIILGYLYTCKFKELIKLFFAGIGSTIFSLICTILIDSYFWQKWIWPEGQVLYYNTILNKSKEFGISPFHWYISSAIPRFITPIFLTIIPFALVVYVNKKLTVDKKSLELFFPVFLFVFLYSFLPHKELRFLLPITPLINALIAIAWEKIKLINVVQKYRFVMNHLIFITVLINSLLLVIFIIPTYYNYPGGVALTETHYLLEKLNNTSGKLKLLIHIDNLAAISGVNRFLEQNDKYEYSKLEHVDSSQYSSHGFDILINEICTEISGYEKFHSVKGFNGLSLSYPFLKLKDSLCIFKRI